MEMWQVSGLHYPILHDIPPKGADSRGSPPLSRCPHITWFVLAKSSPERLPCFGSLRYVPIKQKSRSDYGGAAPLLTILP